MLINFENQIVELLAQLLKQPKEAFDIDAPWAFLGIDSLTGIRLIGRLSDLTCKELDPMLMLDCSCISELTTQLNTDMIAAGEMAVGSYH